MARAAPILQPVKYRNVTSGRKCSGTVSRNLKCRRANRPGRSFGVADDPTKHPFAISQGQTLTVEEMQQLIERADQNKLSKARQRLAEAATGGVP